MISKVLSMAEAMVVSLMSDQMIASDVGGYHGINEPSLVGGFISDRSSFKSTFSINGNKCIMFTFLDGSKLVMSYFAIKSLLACQSNLDLDVKLLGCE